MFADASNHRFEPNEPWRLQERPDAELTGREEPEYGRRYEIFYNEYSVGNLQIFASHHYGPADPQVGTEIELQKSTGSFLLSLTSRHQEMQKKLSV
jgi:hypothetical protein